MAAAETSGDGSDWAREAYRNSDLVAAVLISFRGRSPEADDEDERPSTSAPPTTMGSLECGKRTKRSRWMRIPRISPLTCEGRKITEATAAVEVKEDNRKGKRRRSSPQSPRGIQQRFGKRWRGGDEGWKIHLRFDRCAGGTPQRGGISHQATVFTGSGFPADRDGGGREPTGTDGFAPRPAAIIQKNDEIGAAGHANVIAGRECETSRGDWKMAQSLGGDESGQQQTKGPYFLSCSLELCWESSFSSYFSLSNRHFLSLFFLIQNHQLHSFIRRGTQNGHPIHEEEFRFLKLTKPPVNDHTAEDVQQLEECQPLAPSTPGRKDFLEVPDLNDLPPDC